MSRQLRKPPPTAVDPGGGPVRARGQHITEEYLAELEAEMMQAAEDLEFERAAALRDRIAQNASSGKPLAEAKSPRHPRPSRQKYATATAAR